MSHNPGAIENNLSGTPVPGEFEAALFAQVIASTPSDMTNQVENLAIPEAVEPQAFHELISQHFFAEHPGMRRTFCSVVYDMLYLTQNPTLKAQRAEQLDEAGRVVWAGRAAVRNVERIIDWMARRSDG